MIFVFKFVQTARSGGQRLHLDTAQHRAGSLTDAKTLAGSMLKDATYLGMAPDAIVISDERGFLCEVVGPVGPKGEKGRASADAQVAS